MTALLEVKELSKAFFATQAADKVSFEVNAGEIVSLLGENGAGKSTVIKMLAGVYKADSGEMLLDGKDLNAPGARKQISFVHQALGLIDWMTVAENIALGMGYPKRFGLISSRAMNRQAEQVLDLIGGGVDPQARIFDLPRTERSLLAIARALVGEPKLLVLDEPTASLPAAEVERLHDVLRRLRDEGTGMIYVSHRLDEIYQISTRTVIMRNGKVVADRDVASLPHRELVELIVGHETKEVVFDDPADQVRVGLADLRVDDVGPVTLEVRAGEIVGLCGLRGAGQSQIGKAIAGVSKVTGGQMLIDSVPVNFSNVRAAVAHQVGYVTSDRETEAIAAGLSIRENLILNPSLWGFVWYKPNSAKVERAKTWQVIRDFSVRPPDPEIALDTLSGGNQQKILLGRWLGLDVRVVVLEEPTMGVDVGAKAEIYDLLREAAAAGLAVVVVTTDLEEVTAICHRALVFERGAVTQQISGKDLTIANLIAAASGLTTQESA